MRHTARVSWRAASLALLPVVALGWQSSAWATLIGTSANPDGGLVYFGLGADASGLGTGLYELGSGNCAKITAPYVCTLSGSYTETAASTHTPNATGLFRFDLSFTQDSNPDPAAVFSPVIARSQSSDPNNLGFINLNGATFTLTLAPTGGGPLITAAYPANSLAFQAFADPVDHGCIGTALPAGTPCTIANVGKTAGAIYLTAVSRFDFQIPDDVFNPPAAVPEPTSLALVLLGLAGVGLARRRSSRKSV